MTQQRTAYTQENTFAFAEAQQTLGNTRSDAIFFGDLDGDGDLDAAVQDNEYSSSQIWLNDGSGQMSDGGRIGEQYEGLPLFGDVDGDGDLDAVSRVVRLNDGRGGFRLFQTNDEDFYPLTSERKARKLGDVDGDGDLDYISGQGVWLNDGQGIFTRTNQEPFSTGVTPLALGDLDGDTDLDMVMLNFRSLEVWANNGSGTFANAFSLDINIGPGQDVVLGDLDRDGDLDALIGGFEGAQILVNNGRGTFAHGDIITRGLVLGRVQQSVLGDFNGDSALDIVMAAEFGQDLVWRNQGNGQFVLDWASPRFDNSWSVALGDLNGDDRPDLMFANMGSFNTPGGDSDRIYFNNTPQLSPLPPIPRLPTIQSSAASGAPGSSFAMNATNLPPDAAANLTINGLSVSGGGVAQELRSNAEGDLRLLIETAAADPGYYVIKLEVEGLAEPLARGLRLKADAVIHTPEETAGAISISVPAGIARTLNEQFLPLTVRP